MDEVCTINYGDKAYVDNDMLYIPEKVCKEIPLLNSEFVTKIILHCTDTRPTSAVTIETINEWHQSRGFKCIGYHFVIYPDGKIVVGRPWQLRGAHAVMNNTCSIGVAYVGGRLSSGAPGDTRTFAQKIALAECFGMIIKHFPMVDEIIGHNDVSTKFCPCFNARAEYANFVSKYRASLIY